MPDDEVKFWDSSETPEFRSWLEAAEAIVGTENVQHVLYSNLAGELQINPIYTQGTSEEMPDSISKGIGLRSSNPSGNITGWDIRQRHWVADTKSTNLSLLEDLSKGTRSIELVLEQPGDSSFEELLTGVMLNVAGIGISGDTGSYANAIHFLDYLSNGQSESSANIFDLGVDPIGELLIGSLEGNEFESNLELTTELARKVGNEFANATTIRINGLKYAQTGADTITEIAGVLSTLVAYLRSMEQRGIPMEAAFKQFLLVVSVGTDQFLEIAKLRALRLLVLQIGKACGQERFRIKIQAQTPDLLISRDDPWVNLLRTTVGCFSAATGGADVITLPTFDSAFGIPNEFGLRLARNTHLALMEESNIHRVIDPAGGSWYVESLTQDIAEKAWRKFQEYELDGGFIQQVVTGAFEEQVRISRDNFRSEVISGKKTLIGVNAFREDLATDLARDPYPIKTQSRINEVLKYRISDIESTSEDV
ncbi:MAG: hypothetical protein CL431_07325 [Acidimicrobiaceae bacterium]|jgi:methylmalonyl-CoA mutase|nr:hypothetical protein [Acidimicrobiaceae bacterium]|tara:strand:- start:30741 stop:32180 length:1440 start_codon:yes stop_codon:yes gene_type:complete